MIVQRVFLFQRGEKKKKQNKKEIQIKTRTSAARPERDRRCDRGEPVAAAEAAAAATAPSEADGRSGCSAHSSSVRKVDIRTVGLEAGPTELTPDRTIDHSTVLKRDVLAPSPKSNSSSLFLKKRTIKNLMSFKCHYDEIYL